MVLNDINILSLRLSFLLGEIAFFSFFFRMAVQIKYDKTCQVPVHAIPDFYPYLCLPKLYGGHTYIK